MFPTIWPYCADGQATRVKRPYLKGSALMLSSLSNSASLRTTNWTPFTMFAGLSVSDTEVKPD